MSYYIYKICCDDCPDFVYVGSTKAFRQRKMDHKKYCKNENNKSYNQKLYTTIRENGGWDNWRMVILENIGEVSLTQARIKEEEHRVKLNANLNERKCKGDKKEYNKEYKKINEKYKENQKEYAKEYREKNKEKIKEYDKEYKEKNKEKIMEWKMQKITCECGRTFRIHGKAEHERSLIHKKLIEEKNNI
jgi:hypothetical protein